MKISFTLSKYGVVALLALATCILPAGSQSGRALAEESEAQPLADRNGDGSVGIFALGDSLTYGVGDGTSPGDFILIAPVGSGTAGYPARLSSLLSVPVFNGGIPGERFLESGLERLAELAPRLMSDIVILLEGSNDAIFRESPSAYRTFYQIAINILRASGKTVVLPTLPPTCCNRQAQALITRSYSSQLRNLSAINNVVFVDLERGFDFVCPRSGDCELLNDPEGLHPNSAGYDLIAQMIAAALLEIDLFEAGGAVELEQALALPEGSVLVRVDVPEEE